MRALQSTLLHSTTAVTYQGYALVHLDVQLNVLLVQFLQEVGAPLFLLLHLLRYGKVRRERSEGAGAFSCLVRDDFL